MRAWIAIAMVVAGGLLAPVASADSLSGRWPLDSASGGTTPDASGNGLTGTALTGSITAGGRFSSALTMSTAGQGFRVANSALLEPQQFTVAVWAKRSNLGTTFRQLVEKGGQGCAQASYALNTGPDGGLRFAVLLDTTGGGTTNVTIDNTVDPSVLWDNQWHAIAGTFDGATLRVYVDGAEVGGSDKPAGTTTVHYGLTDRRLAVGKYAQDSDPGAGTCSAAGFAFLGSLDEPRVYRRALDPSDIRLLQSAAAVTPPAIPDPDPDPAPGDSRWAQIGNGCPGAGCTGPITTDGRTTDIVTVAGVAGVPTVAWQERDADNPPVLRVSQPDESGNLWRQLGCRDDGCTSPIVHDKVDFSGTSGLGLADAAGSPLVAWKEDRSAYASRLDQFGVFTGVPDDTTQVNVPRNGATITDVTTATIAGVPHIGWTEDDDSGFPAVRVARQTPGGGWEDVGAPCPGCRPGVEVGDRILSSGVELADVGGTLYVAWKQNDLDSGDDSIRVARFNGTSFVAVGGALDASAQVLPPEMAVVGGVPYVAFGERVSGVMRVKVSRLSGATWVPVVAGANPVNIDPAHDAKEVDLASDGTTPYVAWTETDGDNDQLRVSRLNAGGTAWTELQPGASRINQDRNADAKSISLAIVAGIPYVGWKEQPSTGGNAQARVARFSEARPASTGRPALSGTPKVGETLTCSQGTWSGPNLSFQTLWDRAPRATSADDDPAWGAIDGAVGSAYVVRPEDAGSRVRCRVIASNAGGAASAVSTSLRTDTGLPAATADPVVTGVPQSGATLTCQPGEWTGSPDFSYAWLRDNVVIGGATGPTYVPRETQQLGLTTDENGDGGHVIACRVTATNGLGSTDDRSRNLAIYDNVPLNTVRPTASLNTSDPNPIGRQVTCSRGSFLDDGGDREWAWYRDDAPIAGADQQGYRTTIQDLGHALKCSAIALNPLGRSRPAISPALSVALPPGTTGGTVIKSGGNNEFDPVNLMAFSGDYLKAVTDAALARLRTAVDAATTACRTTKHVPPLVPATIKEPVSSLVRCAMLIHRPGAVLVTDVSQTEGGGVGVFYILPGKGCIVSNRTGGAGKPDLPPCPSLGFDLPSVDPTKAPALDAALQAKLAPLTPVAVLWDVDNNGTADVECPGTAPVLRTMLNRGRWQPRATIVLHDSESTGLFGGAQGDFLHAGANKPGLRDAQPMVCRTSIEPPPVRDPGPCVTDGTIGRVHMTGNFCPISVRQLPQDEIDNLKAKDPNLYNTLTNMALAMDVATHTAYQDRIEVPLQSLALARQFSTTTQGRDISAAYANTSASLADLPVTKFNGGSGLTVGGKTLSQSAINYLKKVRGIKLEAANFALDQIYISRTPFKVNGMDVTPLDNSLGVLVPSDGGEATNTIRSMTLNARNAERSLEAETTKGINKITLAAREDLKAQFRDAADQAESLLPATNLDALKDDLLKKLDLGPFKLSGEAKVKLEKDGTVSVEAWAGLPWLKTDPPADQKNLPAGTSPAVKVNLHGDLSGRLHLDGLRFTESSAYLFGVYLKDIDVIYNDKGLDVSGKILIPPNNAGLAIRHFRIDGNGEFAGLGVDYLAGAGSGIPVGPGIVLTKIGGELQHNYTDPNSGAFIGDKISGDGALAVGASTGGGCPAIGMTAGFTLRFAPAPVYFDATGNVVVACIPLSSIHFYLDSTGTVQLSGGTDISIGPLYYKSQLGFSFSWPKWQLEWNGEGGVHGIPLSAQIQVVLSSRGLAGCGKLKLVFVTLSAGAGITWPDELPSSFDSLVNNIHLFTGCSLNKYRSLPSIVGGSRAAQAGTASFTVPAGKKVLALSLEGAGAAPHVTLRSPSGKSFDFTNATGDGGVQLPDAFGTIVEREDRTVVLLNKPEAGRWTATSAPGTPTVVNVRSADILPDPSIKAKVTGKGSSRRLSYDIRKQAGQVVELVEKAPGAVRVLTTVKQGGRGTLRFTPAEANGSKRTIVAQITQDDLPRPSLTVARFSAPSPKVGRPGRVQVRRSKTKAIVTWTPATFAKSYRVTVRTGAGDVTLLTPTGRARQVVVARVAKGEGLIATVIGVSPVGRPGPARSGRLSGSLRVGTPKRPTPPKKKKWSPKFRVASRCGPGAPCATVVDQCVPFRSSPPSAPCSPSLP